MIPFHGPPIPVVFALNDQVAVAPEYAECMRLSTGFLLTQRDILSVFAVFLVFAQSQMLAGQQRSSLLSELLAIEQSHPGLCNSVLDAESSRKRVTDLANKVQSAIDAEPPSPESTVKALNGIIFGPAGIRPSQDLHDPCNLLLSGVLARGEGYCVGVAGVYLPVAEQLNLPIAAVGTPSHVFLRYDDGTTRINIEINGGTAVSDAQYLERQRIAPKSAEKGVFLRNLSPERFLAQVHNNLGVIYSERKEFERARAEYQTAIRLDRRLPAAWYNLGKDLQEQGRHEFAVRALSKALELHPNDTWALNNRAMAYKALEKPSKARRDLEKALTIDPTFEQGKANLRSLGTVR